MLLDLGMERRANPSTLITRTKVTIAQIAVVKPSGRYCDAIGLSYQSGSVGQHLASISRRRGMNVYVADRPYRIAERVSGLAGDRIALRPRVDKKERKVRSSDRIF